MRKTVAIAFSLRVPKRMFAAEISDWIRQLIEDNGGEFGRIGQDIGNVPLDRCIGLHKNRIEVFMP